MGVGGSSGGWGPGRAICCQNHRGGGPQLPRRVLVAPLGQMGVTVLTPVSQGGRKKSGVMSEGL